MEKMLRRNLFSILTAVIIAYLSLSQSDGFSRFSFLNFPGADKLVHFLMYSGFMSVIIIENRKSLAQTNILLLSGLIPLCYGIIMELLQMWLTESRSASVYDALFNIAGIIFSILLFLVIKPLRNRVFR